MIAKQKNQKLLRSLIKREDWELESARTDLAKAKERLEKASTELAEMKNTLKLLEERLRDSMKNGSNIDFETINMLKQYIVEKKSEETHCKENHTMAKLIENKVSNRVAEKMASKKGYERVFDKQSQFLNKEITKKENQEIEDNWLRRQGGLHD